MRKKGIRATKQENNPAQRQRNPTGLILKLVTGDTHTIQSEDSEAIIASVGNADTTMIAFHAGGKRVYVTSHAIVSMTETSPSDTIPPSTWVVDR